MKGIVTKAVGGFFFPADSNQKIYQTKVRGKIKDKIYPGDLVEFTDGVIERLYQRKNLLFRPSIANVDQVLIMLAMDQPAFDRRLLDRFLLMVEDVRLKPLIIINKMELSMNKSPVEGFEDYFQAGYKIYFISVKEKKGLDILVKTLDKHVNVLTGPSGVGKSSLINEIIDAKLAVAELSPKLKRGVHTTRHVELLPVNKGGWLADTPGFTSLSINHIKHQELRYFFPEFSDYLDKCQFRGCSHTHEPGCAVKDAVSNGLLSRERYKSYQLFYEEINK
ncbi:MAG: ribosome small subunit-dependent GTPase A [Firmicutes bacterium]|nr:ribosome small subunit-dependent GTPase A [Bacillota bacterium]